MKSARGFTLIEILVVVAIIGILATIVYATFGGANAEGRDFKRQTDLRNLQTAIELFKQRNGRYPAMGCGTVSVTLSSENNCPNYIVGLAPEFISRLPYDPKRGTNAGYAYITNSNGNAYKMMVTGTVETEEVTMDHEFASCDRSVIQPPDGLTGPPRDMCGQVIFNGNSTPTHCGVSDLRFQTSYAVWQGYVPKTTSSNIFAAPNGTLDLTQQVICR